MSIIVAVRKHGDLVIASDSAKMEDSMVVAQLAVMSACALHDSCAESIHIHSITIN